MIPVGFPGRADGRIARSDRRPGQGRQLDQAGEGQRGISRPYKKKPALPTRALGRESGRVFEAPKPMREQQNPSTPELHQPLLFAPSELLACGLRDAHHHPLVGVRTEDGVRSWRTSPATAWEHPLVEWARTANSYCSIVLDCDSRESQELACAVEAGYGDLPRPNVAAQRATSGHLHLGWNLRTPVHRGAASRPRPLAALGRIAEYYAVTLRSDRGYVGVLAYNPVHGDYNTVYPRTDPYDLAELARALPAHWRRPSKPADLATAPGRNCALFAALCKLALGGSDEGLLTWARTLNREFSVPLADAEVRGVWRSVCRYRARWRAQGHQQAFLFRQAARGRKGGTASGVARRAGTALEHDRAPWDALGVSRRTWYRYFRGAKTDGESRWAKVGTEANTDRLVSPGACF